MVARKYRVAEAARRCHRRRVPGRCSLSVVHRLAGAAYGIHFADQIALVSVPLVAALAFGASPEVIGILVACQSIAHLVGSLPFGILADRRQLRTLAIVSAVVSLAGSASAVLSIGFGSIIGFGAAVTLSGFGVVLFGLSALSILPRIVGTEGLGKANAAIEIPRALCSFGVPLAIGLFINEIPAWSIFAMACLGSLLALGLSRSLPTFSIGSKQQAAIVPRILEGGLYVLRHRLLLPISLCSICWNLAFAGLLVVLVPVIQDIYGFDPGAFGIALSAFGLAAVFGSWIAGWIAHRLAPSAILLFGPGSSVIAAASLLFIGPASHEFWLYASFFLLGFGPSMWLVAQNAVRQLVTPPSMLGRVNAVIQTAIYGIRPFGALAGGLVAGSLGPQAGLILVLGAYAVSFLVSLFSELRTVASYRSLQHAVSDQP